MIGRYVVEARVGGGGMAAVMRARPPEDLAGALPPVVAIKMLLPQLAADAEFRAMFEEEAEISGQLRHPNVVELFDFGETKEGALFLVMEWIDGLDLGVVLRSFRARRLRMNPPIACAVVEQALRGLHAAHSRTDRDGNPLAVVHRDVSPANVLLSSTGDVKIADFGLARPMHRVRRTQPGIVKGKFAYLAPEQTYDRSVDPRTDVFAAGIVLWEALASRHLFRRSTDLKTVLAIRQGLIRDVRRYAPGIDERLARALEKAVQPDPERRFQSAEAFADALASVLRDKRLGDRSKLVAAVVRDVQLAEARDVRASGPRLSLPRVERPQAHERRHVTPPPLPRRRDRSAPSEPMPLVRTRAHPHDGRDTRDETPPTSLRAR
jgi:serine/threonine-protein kinase